MKIVLSEKTREMLTLNNFLMGVIASSWFYTGFYLMQFGLISYMKYGSYYFDLNNLWSQVFAVNFFVTISPIVYWKIIDLKDWIQYVRKKGVIEI